MRILILFERHKPRALMGEQQSPVLLYVQTDRQVILDPGRTNWPVSPTHVNQESEGEGGHGQRDTGQKKKQGRKERMA